MALVRWEPVRELTSLQQDMNRLFNGFFDAPRAANGNARFVPAMDLVETDEHFVLRADLPGLREEDVKIELEDNVLTVSGERKAEHEDRKEGYYRLERSYGQFARTLTLPEGVGPEGVKASFDRGVLEVEIAKPEQRKPHRVTIGVNGASPARETVEGSES
ncbi:MAG: Hsp20/alpha crystallin family protein [Solirubrobacteraceae bacterium]|jgi:HSP20 family protein